MYFDDLTPYRYRLMYWQDLIALKEVFNIGWLEQGHEYPTGEIDVNFIQKLGKLLLSDNNEVNRTRGIHQCEFCGDQTIRAHVNDHDILLGTSEIWIPASTGRIYAAPSLVYHYIAAHKYLPPLEFIEAVREYSFSTKWNGTMVFRDLIEKYERTTP